MTNRVLHFPETTDFDLYLQYDEMTTTAPTVEIPVVVNISLISRDGCLTPLCRCLQSHTGVDGSARVILIHVPAGERLGLVGDLRALGGGGVPERVWEGERSDD